MKHDYFQEEKLKYEEIEIPDELLLMVRQMVAADRRKKTAAWRNRMIKMAGSVAAILLLCLTIGVNSSYAFAETAVKIPVVKTVAKAVIVRSYKADIIALDEQNSKEKEEKPLMGQEADEPEPSVSGNDTVSENEAPEQPAQPETTEEVPGGVEAWKAEMTAEKLREIKEIYTPDMEERYADEPEKLRTILLAELPEKDISLYGYHENGVLTGTALRVKDSCRYFDWNYMNGTKKLPDISFADADGDGEEELVVLLYNGEPQTKTITREDIEAPDKTAAEGSEASEDGNGNISNEAEAETVPARNTAVAENIPEKKNTETAAENTSMSKTAETAENTTAGKEPDIADDGRMKISAQDAAEDGLEETASGDGSDETAAKSDMPSVSGNDVSVSEKPQEAPKQQAGELWLISLKGENWTASVLSINDYESQIIHQLKAEYDETAGAIQLYLMEEPFGKSEKLPEEEKDGLTYEAVNLAPEREFITEKGLFLHFRMEAVFVNANGEEVFFPLSIKLKAEICLEDGSLVVENIKER